MDAIKPEWSKIASQKCVMQVYGTPPMLTEERQYFETNREDLLERCAGKYVLIKGAELIGAYDDEETAISEGARAFGLESFLVRRVEDGQKPATAPALALGILRASP